MAEETISSIEDLARCLKRRREELGMTQKQLAEYCNLSHNGISRIELAEKSLRFSTLLKLSKFLGFKVALRIED